MDDIPKAKDLQVVENVVEIDHSKDIRFHLTPEQEECKKILLERDAPSALLSSNPNKSMFILLHTVIQLVKNAIESENRLEICYASVTRQRSQKTRHLFRSMLPSYLRDNITKYSDSRLSGYNGHDYTMSIAHKVDLVFTWMTKDRVRGIAGDVLIIDYLHSFDSEFVREVAMPLAGMTRSKIIASVNIDGPVIGSVVSKYYKMFAPGITALKGINQEERKTYEAQNSIHYYLDKPEIMNFLDLAVQYGREIKVMREKITDGI